MEGTAKKLLIDSTCKYDVSLCDKKCENHNVRIFRFKFPEENMILGHECSNHCILHSKVGEEYLSRPFTPISLINTKGYVEFMIKIYFRNVHPKFPAGGKFTQHLDSLKIGDVVQISGPHGKVAYKGKGKFIIKSKNETSSIMDVKKLGLIAGGVGITPALQILRTIINDPEDKINCSFIYASSEKRDILRNEEFEEMTKKLCGRLKIWYTLEKPGPDIEALTSVHSSPNSCIVYDESETYSVTKTRNINGIFQTSGEVMTMFINILDWPFGTGLISKQMIQEHLFPPGENNLNLISGPWPMLEQVIKSLTELGYCQGTYSLYF
ncbi:NADH-cytochrome b5 reductase 3-like [Diorhabda sublineata]|uniref:NADH-cytochrome b5 reductase 3-like n=1 Tax=Diorhabda sublineata TaxID=1163346 RepID=UPI0024E14131|nr:NADH-cytochrome b5 reductase 3-like [Diorhabda sublineata]